ncbi:hypothetical protein Bbelb_297660 [Branchiostoma belcheri]|nr:hypothetical protein Bbelb_297660 [Branchiostoma belcheri]
MSSDEEYESEYYREDVDSQRDNVEAIKEFCQVVEAGDVEKIGECLDKNDIDIDGFYFSEGKFTALHLATDNGTADVIQFLIDKKAGVNIASRNPVPEKADYPLNLVTSDGPSGATPLHLAVRYGDEAHLEAADILIENGANVNARDKNWDTPLHQATYHGNNKAARLLVEAGAGLDNKNKKGKLPEDLAFEESTPVGCKSPESRNSLLRGRQRILHIIKRIKENEESASFARSSHRMRRPARRPIRFSDFPQKSPEELRVLERRFVLDCVAVANISQDYGKANPKMGTAIPPYNAQKDKHVEPYFNFYGVKDVLKTTGQYGRKSTSIDGPVIDRFVGLGKGYQYLSKRNKFGAGHSREAIDGHGQFMTGVQPMFGYRGLYGYRRNTPWLRGIPSPFGVDPRSPLHAKERLPPIYYRRQAGWAASL